MSKQEKYPKLLMAKIREEDIRFGIVITLKEMFGKNRIDEFINRCNLNGWIVNRINIDNRLDVYASAEEEIEFE